jgi:hypothetical protein
MSTYSVRLLAVLLSLTVSHIVSARAGSSRPAADVVTGSGEVTIYPFPAALPSSEIYRVTVNGQAVHVIRSDRGDIAWFACGGRADIVVEVGHEVKRVEVRPLRHGLQPALQGRTLRFRIPGPVKLSIEINGDLRRPLFLFADAPEQDVPQPGAPGVRRFASGQIHEAGELTLASGQSLYLEPGAVVRGTITAQSARNIRIFGRGLFDATSRTEKKTFLRFTDCAEARLEDFLVLGAYGWTLVPWQCQQVRIANVKLVSWRDNDDGIDICASRNVRVEDCFLRTKDDCIALKAHGDRSGAWDVRDVRISRTVFWNAEWGNAMEIGFELRTARVSDVVVQDCDIIRVESGAVLSVHNADFAAVEDIRYEDIRVEDARDKLLELRVGLSIYSQDCPKPYNRSNPRRKPVPGGGPWLPLDLLTDEERTAQDANRGRIRNVVFRNIVLVGGQMPVSLIQGYDALRPVENVAFERVRFHDQVVRDTAALKLSVTNGVGIQIAE